MQNGKIPASAGKLSVISWDLCHNAAGRAMVLADMLSRHYRVEVVGARFPRYGGKIWPPLATSGIAVRSFPGEEFPAHLERMKEAAREIDGDLLLVSKPRLPALALAALAWRHRPRPILLDVDDLETAFFGGAGALALDELERFANSADFRLPFSEPWTRLCESLIDEYPYRTTSNDLLREKFGGIVIAHARDEKFFDPARYRRPAIRASFGYGPGDRVVLFLGTPRRHKGLLELRNALVRLGNPAYKLCIIGGVTNPILLWRLLLSPPGMLRLLPGIDFSSLPRTLMIADAVCLLQDPSSPVSQYQIPAKFTDALAMGIPVLATAVGPMRVLAERRLLTAVTADNLDRELQRVLDQAEERRARALRLRNVFMREFSYAANTPRLVELVHKASSGTFDLPHNTSILLDYLERRFARGGARRQDNRRRSRPRLPATESLDMVVFWKQNDSGIYGRRSDMLAKYLALHPAVRQVVQFDAPISLPRLAWELRWPSARSQGRLVFKNTVARAWGLSGPGKHSFIYLAPHKITDLLPAAAATRRGWSSFVNFVSRQLRRAGVRPETAVFLFYPTYFPFAELTRKLSPALTAADLVDDQTTFYPPGSPKREMVKANVTQIVAAADLVLANCPQLVDLAARLGGQAHLLPNGVEVHHPVDSMEIPADLAAIKRPRVGYTGNLSSRLDLELLRELVRRRPDWQLVLIGSAHLDRSVLALGSAPNVHLLGVKPYPLVRRYIRHFDVALLPHSRNAMTASMHPLKLPLYLTLGIPVVTTDVDNLGQYRPHVYVAGNHADFIGAVEQALRQGMPGDPSELARKLRENSWSRLADEFVNLVRKSLAERN